MMQHMVHRMQHMVHLMVHVLQPMQHVWQKDAAYAASHAPYVACRVATYVATLLIKKKKILTYLIFY